MKLCLLVLLFLSLQAWPVDLPPTPPGFLIGMEIELTPQYLANLTPFFDFEQFQKDFLLTYPHYKYGRPLERANLSFDNYLIGNQEGLRKLPPDIFAQLTEGLVLEENQVLNSQGYLFNGGSPPSATHHVSRSGVFRPRGSDWVTLNMRWNALEPKEKLRSIDFSLLSPLAKAKLILNTTGFSYSTIESEGKVIHFLRPVLKNEFDPRVKKLLEKLSWHRDGDAIEFIHKTPVADLREYVKGVYDFARLVGIESKIADDSSSKLTGVSYHFHVSSERNLNEDSVNLLNQTLLLKRISLGNIADLNSVSGYGFDPDIRKRGLLRVIEVAPGGDEKEIEFRGHPFSFYETLDLAVGLVSESDEVYQARLKRLRKELLTPEVLERIQKKNPSYLFFFYKDMSDAERNWASGVLDFILRSPVKEPADDLWNNVIPNALEEPVLREKVLENLPALAMHLQESELDFIFTRLRELNVTKFKFSPHTIQQLIYHIEKDETFSPRELFQSFILTGNPIPESVLNAVRLRKDVCEKHNIHDPLDELIRVFANVWKSQAVKGPLSPSLGANPTESERVRFLKTVTMWPSSQDDQMIELLKKNEDFTATLSYNLSIMPYWPARFSKKVALHFNELSENAKVFLEKHKKVTWLPFKSDFRKRNCKAVLDR